MAFARNHDLHKRRLSLNVGVSLTLGGLVVLLFVLTMVKISRGSLMEGYDYRPRASLLPVTEPIGRPAAPASDPAAEPAGEPAAEPAN